MKNKSFNTFPIQDNEEHTCVINSATVRKTSGDDAIDLELTVYLKGGKEIKMKDRAYISDNFAKKINAIFASVGESAEDSGFWDGEYTTALNNVVNKPLQILFKNNPKGFIAPYLYKFPNSTISEKWLKRGFGEQEGKIHDAFMDEARYNAINRDHIDYIMDKESEHDRKVEESKSENDRSEKKDEEEDNDKGNPYGGKDFLN